ncbi:TPR repeat domain-containing protein [Chloropicon primus]|uniref:PB1 domain-containing protein n=1 Tax=Chloropicon primus TaxID=1764295 RepID=A0A5B8MJJ2_9CHLO|nr:hypothetical protein A3770_03p20780 [Chloropicon primus]UPQ98772.1 TPR repeat domain-containing protein [Chloropicon primus]|eukprot:QDZ19560.1 hypothetical protein A3770_03p20780 [Chloropicon primus]
MGRSKGKGGGRGQGSTARVVSKQHAEDDKMFLRRSREIMREGNSHLQHGRLEHAKLSFEKALQLCKGNSKEASQLHSSLGTICLLQHNFEGAVKECTLALEIEPYAIQTRHRRARAYELNGNLIQALADVRWLVKLHSQAPKVQQPFVALERKLVEQLRTASAAHKVAQLELQEKRSGDAAETVGIKLDRGGDVRLVEVSSRMNYAELKAVALEKFQGLANFNVKVKDGDGDEITLQSREDVRAALKLAKTPKFFVSEVEEADVVAPLDSELEETRVAPNLMEGITESSQQAAEPEKPEEEVYELDDWMIDFAELFKEHLGIDIDTPLDLSKLAWEKCAEALDSAVQNSKSEALLRQAANKFEEVILTALVNLGNVYMCIARKYIDAKTDEDDAVEEIKKADKELDSAKGMYKTALERKGDFADAVLSLGQLEFEKGKISTSFGVPEGHKYYSAHAEGYFLDSIEFFKQSLSLLDESGPSEEEAKGGKDGGEKSEASLKAQAQVMWGNALYELSQCFATAKKDWKPTLTQAVDKFKEAKCRSEEVRSALDMHCEKIDAEDVKVYMKDFVDEEEAK